MFLTYNGTYYLNMFIHYNLSVLSLSIHYLVVVVVVVVLVVVVVVVVVDLLFR